MAAAVTPFPTIADAVNTVIRVIQSGIPVARIELLDEMQMKASNAYSKLDYAERPTLFIEFHGSERGVAEQVELVKDIAADYGGGEFRWSVKPEERTRLWQARHDAYYAGLALRPGSKGWPTDVCVPISRLAECIVETRKDIEASGLMAMILGHVGDGNFHTTILVDPDDPKELKRAEAFNDRLVDRALAMGGTCTGEHGIGFGKIAFLEREHGEAVGLMRLVKQTLDPENRMNPGKIFRA
jgi:D-lactate dehydrogenase (cytochrome)